MASVVTHIIRLLLISSDRQIVSSLIVGDLMCFEHLRYLRLEYSWSVFVCLLLQWLFVGADNFFGMSSITVHVGIVVISLHPCGILIAHGRHPGM